MSLLCAFTWTSRPAAQGTTKGADRCWISTRIELDERSGEPDSVRYWEWGERRCKKKSLRPGSNWGPTG